MPSQGVRNSKSIGFEDAARYRDGKILAVQWRNGNFQTGSKFCMETCITSLEFENMQSVGQLALEQTASNFGINVEEFRHLISADPDVGQDSKSLTSQPTQEEISNATIMLVDDEPINVKVARKYLQEFGYERFIAITEPKEAFPTIESEMPDVILLDIMMPEVGGIDILREMQQHQELSHIPVIILTATCDQQLKKQVLDLGAFDFLEKPVDPNELAPRVRNALKIRTYETRLKNYAETLKEKVQKRTVELDISRKEVIRTLARAAEYRDDHTGYHVVRVGQYAGVIAAQLGFDDLYVEKIELAAQLHDVGKIGIADEVLLKPGKLTPEEFGMIQKHVGYGKQILDQIPPELSSQLKEHVKMGARILDIPNSPLLEMAARIALTHHEKWDGSGYPLGLSGEHIPIEGRITAVADVFDALSSNRPYKKAFPLEKCLSILEEGRGAHFDPQVLDAFMEIQPEIVEIQMKFADTK